MTVKQLKQMTALRSPLQRYGDPEEGARLMRLRASNESSFYTGGVDRVNGGACAGTV